MKYVAYYRVSTQSQAASRLGLDGQRNAVRQYVEATRGDLLQEYEEVMSGSVSDRPLLTRAIALCKKTHATLLISRLDRLSRSLSFISKLLESGVDFKVVELPEASKFTIQILAVMAEHERDAIALRTKHALAEAKKRGVALGNPRLNEFRTLATKAKTAKADDFARKIATRVAIYQQNGPMSLKSIAERLQSEGVPTAGGGAWWPTTVKNVLSRGARQLYE